MKKLLYLSALALLMSCSTDKARQAESVSPPVTATSSSRMFGAAVGAIDQLSGKIMFKQEQKILLTKYNSLLKKSDIIAGLEHISIDQINGNYYLKGYGNKYKSTMLLQKSSDGSLYAYGVTCTTSACSSTHGCEAKEDGTCSPCSGDCKKTTTSDDGPPQ